MKNRLLKVILAVTLLSIIRYAWALAFNHPFYWYITIPFYTVICLIYQFGFKKKK